MKAVFQNFFLFSVLIFISSFAFGQTTTIDFETIGDGYAPSTTFGSGFSDVFNRTNPNIGGNSSFVWAVEDISGDPSISLDQINVSGASEFTFSIDMLAHHFEDWDDADELRITYSIDGGSYQNLMWVQMVPGDAFNGPAALDLGFDGNGDCGASTTLPSLSTGTQHGCTVSNSNFETFSTGTISLSGNSTLDIELEFIGLTSGDEGIYLDNIVIDVASSGPTTPSITTTTASSITTTSASAGGDVTADGGVSVTERGVVYNKTGTPDLLDDVVVSGSGTGPYVSNLTGLDPASTYYVRAYATNSQGTAYGNEITFNTACNAVSVPFFEGFETAVPPACWTSFRGTNGLGTSNDWLQDFGNQYNGSAAAYVSYESVSGGFAEDWLITPAIDLSGTTNPELTYYDIDEFTGVFNSEYTIRVSTVSQTNHGNFTTVFTYDENDQGAAYTKRTVDLTSYAGQTVYIAFVMSNNNGDSWYIDDVEIKEAPASVEFDNLTSTTTEGNSGTTNHTVDITMDIQPASAVTVNISATGGTATGSGDDYTLNTTSLNFPASGTYPMTQQVSLTINGDTDQELDETVELGLSIASGPGDLGTNTSHTLTITSEELPPVPTTVAFQGFEGSANDTWGISSNSCGINTNPGAGDNPSNERVRTGSASWTTSNTTCTLELNDVNIGGLTNTYILVHLSSTSGTSGNGNDSGEEVQVYAALNGASFSGIPDITVEGYSNARWPYGSNGPTTTAGTDVSVSASAGDHSTLRIDIPDGNSSIALKIIADNNSSNEYWNVDDIEIIGTPSATSVDVPTSLSASAVSTSQIDLNFGQNTDNDNVVIVYNTTGSFTTPSGTPPALGNAFAGGTIIYNGTGSSFNHMGLNSGTQYYYEAYSYDGSDYSAALSDDATTFSPSVGFDNAASSVAEGNSGSVTHLVGVTMDIEPSSVVQLNISASGGLATGSGDDYTLNTTSLTFNSGGSYPQTQQVSITIFGDTDQENDETIDLSLSVNSGSSNTGTISHTVTITTEEPLPGTNLLCDNFEDGDISDWASSSNWDATTSNTINGTYSIQNQEPGCDDDGRDYLSYDLSSQSIDLNSNSTTWQFNLENGSWDPSTNNNFGVFLTANSLNLGYSNTVDGYYVGVNPGVSPGTDNINLWKIENGFSNGTWTSLVTSTFNWGSGDRLGIQVTRSATGEWELKYDTDGDFDNLTSAGTVTDNTYNFSSGNNYFGLVFEYSSSRSCELWWDDISMYQGTSACPVTSSGPYHWLPTSGTHDFNDAANWSPQRTSIQNDDVLIFDNGGSSTASDVPSQTIGQMQVIGTDITFTPQTGGGLKTFTIAGVTGGDDFELDASSVFTLDSPEDFDIELSNGATAVIYGDISVLSTGADAYHGFKGADAGAVTFKNGASFTQGPRSNGNVFGSTGVNNSTIFESGSEFVSVSGANPFAKAQPDSKVDFQTGSLYKHQQATEPSIVGRTYANIEFDYNGNIGFATGSAGGDEFTCDDFTVSQGDVEFFYSLVALPLNLNIKGDISVAAGSNIYFRPDAASANSSVRINGSVAQSINGAGNFEIGQFGKLEIENDLSANTDVKVYGLLELKSGQFATNNNLTIASDANSTGVLDDFTPGYTGAINGDITVERYVANVNNGFHFVGSPVSGSSLSDWGGEFSIAATNGGSNNAQVIPTSDCSPTALDASSPYGGLFDYREDQVTDCRFEGWHVRTSGAIQDAQGFAGVIPNGTTIDLSGPANTGNISSYTLTRSASNNTPDHRGFNMLANPYPSPLEWTDVAAANTDIDGVAYLFQTSGSYNGTFQTINNITGGTIASSQAFQVEVLNIGTTTVNFTNSMRRTTGNNDFLRQSQPYDSRIILELEGNGFADRTIVAYSDNFTAGYDRKYDAKKLKSNNGQPTLYTFSNPAIEKQSINAIANSDKYDVLPVGLLSGANGTFTIRANELDVNPLEVVFLEDLENGTIQNLNKNPEYTFTADANDAAHRFNLHMMPAPERSSVAVSCDLKLGSINVDFEALSINGQSISWDNAVLKNANGQIVNSNSNPTNNWTIQNLEEGAYELILEMGTYSVSGIITVDAKDFVIADYSIDKTVAEIGESVNFTDLSSGGLYYDWDMGDGNIIYNTQNPSHSYLNEGNYTVTLNVSSDDCSADVSKQIEVRQKLISGVDYTDGSIYNVFSVSNNIIIEGSDLSDKSISVYNVLGQKMNPNSIRNTNERVELSMTMVASGIYFVELISENGKERITEQVFVDLNK